MVMFEFFISFFVSFLIILVTELGDKTQIIILCISMEGKYSHKLLALGAVTGFAAMVAISGTIAAVLFTLISVTWIELASGFIFILLGAVQIGKWVKERPGKHEQDLACEEEKSKRFEKTRFSFWAGFLAILIMEFGDKTQIATIMLASTSSSFLGTLVGAWCALSLLAVFGVFAGRWIGSKAPSHVIELVSSIVFVVVGFIMIFIVVEAFA